MGDVRIQTRFFGHPKTVKLKRRCGAEGVLAFLELWGFCADHAGREGGDLSGMDNESVAIAGGFDGDHDQWIAALVEVGYLDGAEGGYQIHDFADHQPFAATKPGRAAASRRANAVRWHNRGSHAGKPHPDCPLCSESESESDKSESDSDPGRTKPESPTSTPSSTSTSISTPSGSDANGRRVRSVDLSKPPGAERVGQIKAVFDHWAQKNPDDYPPGSVHTGLREWGTIHDLLQRENLTVEKLKLAIDGFHLDEWAQKNNPTLAFCLKDPRKYMARARPPPAPMSNSPSWKPLTVEE